MPLILLCPHSRRHRRFTQDRRKHADHRITNLWPNRLIGGAMNTTPVPLQPWSNASTTSLPPPGDRITFVTWRGGWNKDDTPPHQSASPGAVAIKTTTTKTFPKQSTIFARKQETVRNLPGCAGVRAYQDCTDIVAASRIRDTCGSGAFSPGRLQSSDLLAEIAAEQRRRRNY